MRISSRRAERPKHGRRTLYIRPEDAPMWDRLQALAEAGGVSLSYLASAAVGAFVTGQPAKVESTLTVTVKRNGSVIDEMEVSCG